MIEYSLLWFPKVNIRDLGKFFWGWGNFERVSCSSGGRESNPVHISFPSGLKIGPPSLRYLFHFTTPNEFWMFLGRINPSFSIPRITSIRLITESMVSLPFRMASDMEKLCIGNWSVVVCVFWSPAFWLQTRRVKRSLGAICPDYLQIWKICQ